MFYKIKKRLALSLMTSVMILSVFLFWQGQGLRLHAAGVSISPSEDGSSLTISYNSSTPFTMANVEVVGIVTHPVFSNDYVTGGAVVVNIPPGYVGGVTVNVSLYDSLTTTGNPEAIIDSGSASINIAPPVTDPQPTEPQPTEPQPTEPQPTEAQPTEPITPETTSTTSTSESTTEETSESTTIKPNYQLRLNGEAVTKVSIIHDENVSPPEGYTEEESTVQGSITSIFTKNGSLPLLHLLLPSAEAADFYFFDERDSSIYKFYQNFVLDADGKSWTIYPIFVKKPHADFSLTEVNIAGQKTSAYKASIDGKAYTILYAAEAGQSPKFHLMEEEAGNVYHFLPFLAANLGALSPTPTATPTPTTKALTTPSGSQIAGAVKGKIDWILIAMIAAIVILLGAIVAVLVSRARNPQPLFTDDHDFLDDEPERGGDLYQAASLNQENHKPLPDLTPNDFDNVDKYFAGHAPESDPRPAQTLGVRAPSHIPQAAARIDHPSSMDAAAAHPSLGEENPQQASSLGAKPERPQIRRVGHGDTKS